MMIREGYAELTEKRLAEENRVRRKWKFKKTSEKRSQKGCFMHRKLLIKLWKKDGSSPC
jgi:hypothetical protein